MMISIEAMISAATGIGLACVGMISSKFRTVDKDINKLSISIENKPDLVEIKDLLADKLAPLHVLLHELKEDVKGLDRQK